MLQDRNLILFFFYFEGNAFVLQDHNLISIFVYFQAIRTCYRTRIVFQFSFILRQCLHVTGQEFYINFRLFSGNAYVLQDQNLILFLFIFRQCFSFAGPESYFNIRLFSGNAYVLQDQNLILIFVYFQATRTCYRTTILY